MSPADAEARVHAVGLVPVIALPSPDAAVPLCQALVKGGIDVVEITFRTGGAAEAMAALREELPEVLVGAGTVTSVEQLDAAVGAGAAFAVAPGLNPEVVERADEVGLAFWPGVCTPTDIEAALRLGHRFLKFFPAGPMGGAGMLKALLAPYAHLGVRFIPTGGIDAGSAATYWTIEGVAAIGGSWVAPADLIREQGWEQITQLASDAVTARDAARGRS
ncbi:MAG TPA: bifunctional 4-hydroxy-2-oxoglutarate aldolase/2-dehydro-3-deoxy-phosphogluconate aldolase [Egibacteraceae bacterium]|nr:bifunctional 4-hydroxy-2-oxoglutarate aldolase/2-dehydro-3-deoxy-phosphogluconate aldolase [Egibacteraceae bacterium]